eukprot:11957878-Alexandrium_andersonii.AAC.1
MGWHACNCARLSAMAASTAALMSCNSGWRVAETAASCCNSRRRASARASVSGVEHQTARLTAGSGATRGTGAGPGRVCQNW